MQELLYTSSEGGRFSPLSVSKNNDEVISELNSSLFITDNFQRGGPERSMLCGIAVHSVKFLDGTIWDAYLAYHGLSNGGIDSRSREN